MKPASFVACVATLLVSVSAEAQIVAQKDRFSDVTRLALPAAAAALSLYKDDTEGLTQFAMSTALTAGGTELLKVGVKAKRPDGSQHSFPSGHVSIAFNAAAYVHERYSFQWALPFYGLATLSAYQRVHTHNHFTRDVVAGAAVGVISAWTFTRPFTVPRSTASIGYLHKTLRVDYAMAW